MASSAGGIGGTGLHPLHELFERGPAAGCDDGQLLARFAADGRDEAAFGALVARHGPMVLATARAVLRHEQDAEDAFQATFLALARRARSVRAGSSLAAWLHRVAHRSAVEASRAARRRRAVEGASAPGPRAPAGGADADPDLAATVRAEVGRLPEVNRLPVVLCDLEGLTYLEAAARLGWTEPTLRNRLAQARSRLRARLARRGYADLAAPLAWGGAGAGSAVPAALARSALALALGRAAAATPVSALAQTLTKGTIVQHPKTWIAALLAAATLGAAGLAALNPVLGRPAAELAPDLELAVAQVPDAVVRGRVIDPDGRPVADATVRASINFNHPGPPPTVRTDPDGSFSLAVPTKFREAAPLTPFRGVTASAPGFGPGWTLDTRRPDVVVRLVPPGPPIEGRLVDAAGRPVAGATITVQSLLAPIHATSRTEAGTLAGYFALPPDSEFGSNLQYLPPPPAAAATATDADGRFRLADLGPERIAMIAARAPTAVATVIPATTRPGPAVRATRRELAWVRPYTFQPARFELALPPTRPIAGTITDAASGRPLAGWKVQGAEVDSIAYVAAGIEASSDEQGRYALAGLPVAGTYRVFLAPPAGQPYLAAGFRAVPAPAGDGPLALDHAARRGVVVRGRITDKQTGAPLAGSLNAEAFVDNPHLKDFAGYAASQLVYRYTDADGRYEVVVPPGPGVLGFRAREEGRYRSGQGSFGIARGQAYPTVGREMPLANYHVVARVDPPAEAEAVALDLQVDPDRTIDLAILDPEGRPIGGVEVEGQADFLGGPPVWEDSATVTLRAFAPGSSRRVTVRHPGRKLVGSAVIAEAAGSPQAVRLVPWGEIHGRIVGDDGQPRPGIRLLDGGSDPAAHPTPAPGGDLPGGNVGLGIAADPRARFAIVGLAPGLHYAASARDAEGGVIGGLFDDATVEAGEVRDLGDLKVRPLPPRPAPRPK